MAKNRIVTIWIALVIVLSLAGCASRDPKVRKQKYMESGRRFYEKGDYRSAAIQFSNVLQIDGRDAEGHHQLAKTYMKMESWPAAYLELSRTIDLKPDNYEAQVEIGNLLLGGRQLKQAREKGELVREKQPSNAAARALLANVSAAEGNNDMALTEIRRAIELAPREPKYWANLALFQGNAKQFTEAEQSYRKALELDPKDLSAVQALANFYQMRQNWPEAEKMLRNAINLAPKDLGPRLALSRLYLMTNRPDQAEQTVRETTTALADNPDAYRLLADYYLSRGDGEKGLAELRRLRDQHPKDKGVLKSYIRVLMVRGQLDEAAKLNDGLIKENKKDTEAQAIRSELLVRRGDGAQALELLRDAVKADAANPEIHYHMGNALQATGNLGQAEQEFLEATRLRPTFLLAHRSLAEVAAARGDVEQLATSANQLITADPADPSGYLYRASAEAHRKQYANAEADLQKVLSLQPNSAVGHSRLGQLRVLQGRDADAEKELQKSLSIVPNNEAMNALYSLYRRQKQPAKLLAALDEQLARAPNNAIFHLQKAGVLGEAKRYPEAEQEAQRSVELDSRNPVAISLLGELQAAQGNMDKAVASYEQAVKANPNNLQAALLLASMYDRLGNWQKAEEGYRKILAVQPDNPLASNNLAFDMTEHGENLDVALSLAQKARSAMPEMPTTADTLAWAYYKKGAYINAIDLLEDAVKNSPQSPTFHYHLGMAYLKNKEGGKARTHLERALQLDPKFAAADEARRELSNIGKS